MTTETAVIGAAFKNVLVVGMMFPILESLRRGYDVESEGDEAARGVV